MTNFRVMVLKSGTFGSKQVRSSYSLLDLKELASTKHAEPKVRPVPPPGGAAVC